MTASIWIRVLLLALIAPFCCLGSGAVSVVNNSGCNATVGWGFGNGASPSGNDFLAPGCTSTSIGVGAGTTFNGSVCSPSSQNLWFNMNDGTGWHLTGGSEIAGQVLTLISGGCGSAFVYSNSLPGNSYEGCLWVTNTATGPVTPIGAAYVSQPCPGGSSLPTGTPLNTTTMPTLYPGQSEAYCYTNASPFTQVILMPVLDSGGFSDNYDVLCQQAGTNSNNTAGGNGNGTPSTGGTNGVANAPGSGWGNNTNLTGQQYASGVSNTIAAITGEGTALGNALNGQLGAIGATLHTISGQLGGTNTGSGSNVWIVGSNGSTNALAYTNLLAGTNGTLSMGLTNMWGAGSNMLEVLTNALGGVPSLPTGSPSVLSFAFCGYTLNLDPEVEFPGLPSLIRAIIGWGASIWFGLWFGQRIWNLTTAYSQAELGGIPDLDAQVQGLSFGLGGNAAGLAVALIVPIIFIAIWVGVFTIVIGWGLSVIGGSNWTLNPFSQMNSFSGSGSAALYLMEDLLPLSFLLSLIWTRLGCEFGMALLVAAGSSVSRYLFGK